jgi:hypothetical protein
MNPLGKSSILWFQMTALCGSWEDRDGQLLSFVKTKPYYWNFTNKNPTWRQQVFQPVRILNLCICVNKLRVVSAETIKSRNSAKPIKGDLFEVLRRHKFISHLRMLPNIFTLVRRLHHMWAGRRTAVWRILVRVSTGRHWSTRNILVQGAQANSAFYPLRVD